MTRAELGWKLINSRLDERIANRPAVRPEAKPTVAVRRMQVFDLLRATLRDTLSYQGAVTLKDVDLLIDRLKDLGLEVER